MQDPYSLPEDLHSIRRSAFDSVQFALRCLEKVNGRYRAISSFVDVDGQPMHWHDFGDLEGPGWAANAVGGAALLYRWAESEDYPPASQAARGLIDHVLQDGFLRGDGFIYGYRDTAKERLCLNFKHGSDWFCPGSMAKVALQMLWMSDLLGNDPRAERLRRYAPLTAEWIAARVEEVEGWYPRRCTPEGRGYPGSAEGGRDKLYTRSGDGLYIVWLLLELSERRIAGHEDRVRRNLDAIVQRGGIYGSINHDTYDTDENVARAETFRLFLRAARFFGNAKYREFAYGNALAGLERFKMSEDRNGVATRGLLFMEDSWDTAYLWESAECALTWLEAFGDTKDERYRRWGTTVLQAIARHHYGPHGFLTEGVDWNNHVGKQHHIDGAEFGAIRYTEPLLNNLHHIEPAVMILRSGNSGAAR